MAASSPLFDKKGDNHSTLEANPASQVPDSEGLQHVGNENLMNGYGDDGIEVSHSKEQRGSRCGLGRKAWWIILAIAALLIVGAVIGGAVGGTRKKPSSNSGNSKPASSTSTSTAASMPAKTTSSKLPFATYAAGLRKDPNLATIAYPEGNGRLRYHVYYQDEEDYIKESIWDQESNVWNTPVRLVSAMPRSPLSATVDIQDDSAIKDTRITLFYLDSENVVKGRIWTSSGGWSDATIGSENYIASSTSSIAVISDLCARCTNKTIAMFQDPAGRLQVANGSVDEKASWQTFKADADPLNATSLAALENTGANEDGLSVSQQLFLYQRSDGTLVANTWNAQQNRWFRESFSLDKLPLHTRLSAFAFGGLTNGETQYENVVSSSPAGVSVDWWSGAENNGQGLWEDPVRPAPLQQADPGSAVASHSWGSVFMTKGGLLTQWSMGDNGTDWSLVGGVPTS